ncbi:uncharacterized protein LOC144792778 isoform X2 [Lissotriton helveticus]
MFLSLLPLGNCSLVINPVFAHDSGLYQVKMYFDGQPFQKSPSIHVQVVKNDVDIDSEQRSREKTGQSTLIKKSLTKKKKTGIDKTNKKQILPVEWYEYVPERRLRSPKSTMKKSKTSIGWFEYMLERRLQNPTDQTDEDMLETRIMHSKHQTYENLSEEEEIANVEKNTIEMKKRTRNSAILWSSKPVQQNKIKAILVTDLMYEDVPEEQEEVPKVWKTIFTVRKINPTSDMVGFERMQEDKVKTTAVQEWLYEETSEEQEYIPKVEKTTARARKITRSSSIENVSQPMREDKVKTVSVKKQKKKDFPKEQEENPTVGTRTIKAVPRTQSSDLNSHLMQEEKLLATLEEDLTYTDEPEEEPVSKSQKTKRRQKNNKQGSTVGMVEEEYRTTPVKNQRDKDMPNVPAKIAKMGQATTKGKKVTLHYSFEVNAHILEEDEMNTLPVKDQTYEDKPRKQEQTLGKATHKMKRRQQSSTVVLDEYTAGEYES